MTNVFRDVVTASCDITIFIDECLQLWIRYVVSLKII